MIIPKTSNSEQLADILGVVVDDYLERRSRGEHQEIEQIARQHPELADVIRQSLRALEVVGDSYSSGGSVSLETDFGREKRLGDFRILNELGRGGMGVVYVAEQISMGGRKVALKILPFAGIVDQKQLQRFRNEVRAAASLDHPNIVSVYSFGEERGIHFYAMQLIHGQNLATVIDQLRELRRQTLPLSGSSLSDVLSASNNIQPATGNTEPTEDLRVGVEPLSDAQVGSHSPGSDTVVEVQGLLSTKGSPRLPEPLLVEALEAERRVLGNEHSQTLNSMDVTIDTRGMS
ncbi:MAG: protein kinase [Pirellula sp.]